MVTLITPSPPPHHPDVVHIRNGTLFCGFKVQLGTCVFPPWIKRVIDTNFCLCSKERGRGLIFFRGGDISNNFFVKQSSSISQHPLWSIKNL